MRKTLILNFKTHQEIHRSILKSDIRELLSLAFRNPHQQVDCVLWGGEVIWINQNK